ncbi:helix-turn-helix domain-containing protein [Fimbriiglobus ruber]|uniref:Transcriptional regulator, Cro/CI family n=1 Tax=Fimbriiglobus ruber TaxID=1908690 RepID=A0A225DM86_9BACT|nr:helix-turn-helix transcriptional regulator [Fimbriiglobus ruber]OWK42113.1 Transcriptional regulator, Cro/CI family [Fimbriiglobus ruber]
MTADLNQQLGATIRQNRVLLGLSQEALGKRIGVTFQQIQKYEKGKNQVSLTTLVRLAEAFETTVGELVESALGKEKPESGGLSNRQMLELQKRLAKLKPHQLRGIKLLVHNLVDETD